jgi:hypothetical protein
VPYLRIDREGVVMTEYYDDPRGRIARDRMLGAVRSQLGHEPFTANSLLDLVQWIEVGAAEMVAQGRLDPDDMDRAEGATFDLLHTLSNVRLELDSPVFTEESVNAARIRLCPGFFPFC